VKNTPDLEIVNMIRYDTLDYINVRPKLTSSQLHLLHGTNNKSNEETKKTKQTIYMLRRNSPVIKPNSQSEIYSQLKILLK